MNSVKHTQVKKASLSSLQINKSYILILKWISLFKFYCRMNKIRSSVSNMKPHDLYIIAMRKFVMLLYFGLEYNLALLHFIFWVSVTTANRLDVARVDIGCLGRRGCSTSPSTHAHLYLGKHSHDPIVCCWADCQVRWLSWRGKSVTGNSLARTAYASDDADCYQHEHESGLRCEARTVRLVSSQTLSFPCVWTMDVNVTISPETLFVWFYVSTPPYISFFFDYLHKSYWWRIPGQIRLW
jgi:hypothetical protein